MIRSTLPPLISDTLVTGLVGAAVKTVLLSRASTASLKQPLNVVHIQFALIRTLSALGGSYDHL